MFHLGLRQVVRAGPLGVLHLGFREMCRTCRGRDCERRGEQTGRGEDCDLVIHEKLASRKHLSIRLMRTHFYLVDHSLNGTFVSLESGEEVHVLRKELLLDGSGKLTLGSGMQQGAQEIITFTRDRRSMYRVD